MENKILKNAPKEITIKQEVRFGKPTVNNTRVTIEDILNLLKAGYVVKEIPEQYPGITQEGAASALGYAASV